ncbi:MAG: hypothetical protein ABFD92_09445 [Planctomycetaceae bacterium]|nr:hypothetical protein [Planctomycetaceae bacterium]
MKNSRTLLLVAGLAVLLSGVLGVTQSSVTAAGDEKTPCTQPCKDTDACKTCCKGDCKACCGDNCAACCKDKAAKACTKELKACCPVDGHKDKAGAAAVETKSDFANTKCPMMGSKINPAKVTAALTREFKGQKVAFCCGGCPAAWDKLSDADKQTKLDAAK